MLWVLKEFAANFCVHFTNRLSDLGGTLYCVIHTHITQLYTWFQRILSLLLSLDFRLQFCSLFSLPASVLVSTITFLVFFSPPPMVRISNYKTPYCVVLPLSIVTPSLSQFQMLSPVTCSRTFWTLLFHRCWTPKVLDLCGDPGRVTFVEMDKSTVDRFIVINPTWRQYKQWQLYRAFS